MASIQAFRDIANNTSVSDSRYVYFANGLDDEGYGIQEKQTLCFNAAGKPRNFRKPLEADRKADWATMRQNLCDLVAEKLDMNSETFKKIEKELFGKIVGGTYDPKAAAKPLRKRDVVKVLTLMDRAIHDNVNKDCLKTSLFDYVCDSLDHFLDGHRRSDVSIVPNDRKGEVKRVLADLVNKAASKPLPLGNAEIAKLKKKFSADFRKAGFLDEEPGCEKSAYDYQGKRMIGKAAVKWEMANEFFDKFLAADFRDFDPSTVTENRSRAVSNLSMKRQEQLSELMSIARVALGKHEGVKGGNGYMGLTDNGYVVKLLTHSKERKAFADGKNEVELDVRTFVRKAAENLRERLLEIARDIDEGLANRVEEILKFDVKNNVQFLSRANVAKALNEISKSFVGANNEAFNLDDVKHANTYSDSTLERVFRDYATRL